VSRTPGNLSPYPSRHSCAGPRCLIGLRPQWISTRARVAGLVSREQKDLAVEIIEAEIRSAEYELLLEVSRLVLSGDPIEIARRLRERAERVIRPTGRTT